MKPLMFPFVLATFLLASSSCQQNGHVSADEINDTVEAAAMHPSLEPVNLIPVVGSPEFEQAELSLRKQVKDVITPIKGSIFILFLTISPTTLCTSQSTK
jgi:hypothetical protein